MKKIKVGEIIHDVEITDISSDGRSIAKYDQRVVFVKLGVPGDRADIKITAIRKKHLEGYVYTIHKPSPERVEPFCDHHDFCGGCKWQHLDYHGQLTYKQKNLNKNFEKIAEIPSPKYEDIVPSKETTFFRNKLEFTFSTQRWFTKEEIASQEKLEPSGLGFHMPKRYDKILDIEKCYLQKNPSNEIRNALKNFALQHGISFYNFKTHSGLLRNLIIRTSTQNEVMVILQCLEPHHPVIHKILDYLRETFSEITSLYYIVNSKKNDSYADQNPIHFYGKTYIEEKIESLTFRISPKSFFQTNTLQTLEMMKIVKEMAACTGQELLYDLYAGIGTFALYMAKSVKAVIGIDNIREAVTQAGENAVINRIENAHFYCGNMEALLNEEWINTIGKPDIIIADPPRVGMHPSVIKILIKISVRKIIYISCNPATQARDLKLLASHYALSKMQALDMFPHSQHVENIMLLTRKE